MWAKQCQPLQFGCFGGKIGTTLFISNFFFYLSLYLSPGFYKVKIWECLSFLKKLISVKHLLLFWCKDSQIWFSGASRQNFWSVSRQILECQQLRWKIHEKLLIPVNSFSEHWFQWIFPVNIFNEYWFRWTFQHLASFS